MKRSGGIPGSFVLLPVYPICPLTDPFYGYTDSSFSGSKGCTTFHLFLNNQAMNRQIHMRLCGLALVLLAELMFSNTLRAQTKDPWTAPPEANHLKNPLAGNATALKEGKVLYIKNCAPCHGNKGKGDGIAAVNLKPKPADHTSAAVQGESDGALFWKLSEGHPPMPGYKNALPENERWELIDYIRSLEKHR